MDRKAQRKVSNPIAHAQLVAQQIAISLGQRTGTGPLSVGVMAVKPAGAGEAGGETKGHFLEEVEINDYPQQARWKVRSFGAVSLLIFRFCGPL